MRFATRHYSAALTTALALSAAVSARRYPDSDAGSGQKQKVMSGSGRGDAGSNPLDDDFAAFARAALDRWHVPGIAVAVVDREETWTEGYGISSFPSTPVTPSTLFYGGSTTKAFTAAIVSLLIASGEHSVSPSGPLSWRTPLAQLLGDDFVLAPEYDWAAAHLTLEDALSHRTGFPRHDKALGRQYGADAHAATVRDVARSLRYLPMVSEPRVEWRYCNVMYMVVSHAVQVLTNEWLGDVMRDRIWAPLGMNDTFLSVEEAIREGRVVADGYYWDYKGEREGKGKGGFVEVPKLGLGLASGAGGVVSNVGDYARWVRCLIRGDREGDGDGCTVLPKEAHRELKKVRIVQGPESKKGYDAPLAYGLGWEVGTYKGHRLFKHSGGMEAYGALVYFFPDLEYGVVTLANTAVTSNIVGQELIWKLVDDKLGIPKEDRYDWAGLGDKTIQKALKQPETAVEELYPERANPPLPRTLPLQEYVGVYSHPAYQNITIELVDGTDTPAAKGSAKTERKGAELKANRGNMEWQMMFEFIHVSGEFWAVVIDMLNTPNSLNGQLARAEFVVGVKGKVDKLEMEFLEDGSEGIVVFDRVA
ncbi:beta-lactamase/transpeptidase-like protein [Annulohypoxylon truncatum]|uniref:beta-lactamase/transpeptidase-like protein n=1 Tax=Annulohypoxylon truncatum TaxID=327061 RepID=UPI002008DE7A|nr:beta-lactamase/transpeptidase-like protein [Annulohypoxylon truncatum]KAI1208300.1 beta-lactamase/transpeptidase-like protein [Annulohypoxylon truncatum]